MAVELILPVSDGLDEDKPQSRYSIERFDYSVVDRGLVDRFIGQETHLSMVGKGVSLGEWVTAKLDDCAPTGSNLSSTGYSIKSIQITDDGVAPPTYFSLKPVGDSITRQGSTVAPRSSNGSVFAEDESYWAMASLRHCANDYFFLPNQGWSGENTGMLLNRLPGLIAEEGDLWILMSGTNDILGGLTLEESKSNWDQIAADLMAAGKKLLIVPVAYRNRPLATDPQGPAFYNTRADDLNAHLITIAASDPNIAIAEVNTEWNTLVMTDQVTWGGVTDDGLHPNGYGGVVLGKEAAIALDLYFPSVIENKVSIVNTEFTGTGGTLSLSTGTMPDDWKGYYAKNGTEDGFTGPIDRGDGKVWWKCRSNGGTVSNQNNRIKFESKAPDDGTDGWYVGEVELEFVQGAEVLSKCTIAGQSDDGAYYPASHHYLDPIEAGSIENNVPFTIRTPSIKCTTGTKEIEIDIAQGMGPDVILYVTGLTLYKVRDRDWV